MVEKFDARLVSQLNWPPVCDGMNTCWTWSRRRRTIRNCLSSLLLALTSLRLARASTPMYSVEDELIIEPGRSFQNYWRDLWPLRRAILHSRLA